MVAVKTTATDGADRAGLAADAGRGRRHVVVVMQNGLGVEAPFAEAAPDATVLGAMCFMCSNKVGPGPRRPPRPRARSRSASTAPTAGRRGDPATSRPVWPICGPAGVTATPVDDLETGRWQKLVWNIPFNGLSVVLDAGTDEMLADPVTRGPGRGA